MFDQNIFLDALKRRLNFKNDVTLASKLKIEASSISLLRSNVRPISAKFLARIRRSTGIPVEELKRMGSGQLVQANPDSAEHWATPIDADNSRKRYAVAFKLKAVGMVSESDSVVAVAKRLKLPKTTLHNWVNAYRQGDLSMRVSLGTDEIDYLQGLLKARAANLRKNPSAAPSQPEKSLIAALRKKLRESAS